MSDRSHKPEVPISEMPGYKQLLTMLTKEEIEEFHGVFQVFDIDGDETISVKELSQIMRTLGQNPTEEEIINMMAEADEDESGEIDFYEFCMLMGKRRLESEQDEELIEVFKQFDKDGDGFINAQDLKAIFVELGQDKISEDDCEFLIKLHDVDEDGLLDFNEFVSTIMAK